jgi:hypothetical protein
MANADGDCNQSCIKTFGYPLSAYPHLFISYSLLISYLSYLVFSLTPSLDLFSTWIFQFFFFAFYFRPLQSSIIPFFLPT